VRDDASPKLRQLRRDLRGAQGQLVQLLERLIGSARGAPPGGRCVGHRAQRPLGDPVRAGARAIVGGIVHDTSSTGATLFVEPPAAVEFGNRIRELEVEEHREIERILAELTDELRPLREPMLDALDALVELDSLHARARWADDMGCAPCDLVPAGEGFTCATAATRCSSRRGVEVVPFDLEMLDGEHTLLVSGPNTGWQDGAAQGARPRSRCSCRAASRRRWARRAASPSTTTCTPTSATSRASPRRSRRSARTSRTSPEIVGAATHASLVLIDELGSGTDPVEGAALGGAILEELTARGTTDGGHHAPRRAQGAGHRGARRGQRVAAVRRRGARPDVPSAQGDPGRSYGSPSRGGLAMPAHIVERATERIPKGERDVDALLAELERARRRSPTASAGRGADRRQPAEGAAAGRAREGRARPRAAGGARGARRGAALPARRAQGGGPPAQGVQARRRADGAPLDERARDARRTVEELAGRQQEHLERLEREERNVRTRAQRAAGPKPADTTPQPATPSRWGTLGGKLGRLVEVRGKDAVVSVGALKLTVPIAAVDQTRKELPKMETVPVMLGDAGRRLPPGRGGPARAARRRGRRPAARRRSTRRCAPTGARSHHPRQGHGALRERVTELLRKDTRARSFRMGLWNEGGAGVTVVELD
jgi:DNA mismatch repair protein MutS2